MLKPIFCAALGLGAVLAAPAQAGAPYPPSTLITGIRWDIGSYRWTGAGGDIWPITWAAEGELITSWGDGIVGCRQKASYGVAAIGSELPGTGLAVRHCGPGPHEKGKMMTMLAAGGTLLARVAPQSTGSGFPIWRSNDGGRSWTKPDAALPFKIDGFVQFGRGNAGAPGGYAYALEPRGTSIHLLRAPPGSAHLSGAYEYFAGSSASPAWSRSRTASRAIFSDPAGVQRPTITYNPGVGRYLLALAPSRASNPSAQRIGLFEAPAPWGPWRTVTYAEAGFLGMRGGQFLGMHFPIKWQADGGRTLWVVFSCHNQQYAGACGQYHDRFNLMRATLTVAGER